MLTLAVVAAVSASIGADLAVRVVVPVGLIILCGLWARSRGHQVTTNRSMSEALRLSATGVEASRAETEALRRRTEEVWDRTSYVRRLIDDDRARLDRLKADLVSRTWANTQMTREGLRLLRGEVAELAQLAEPSAEMHEEIRAVTTREPQLSIAIPGYNRPELLAECLESIVAEIEASGTDEVEVWVTDDRSTRRSAIQTARDYATRYPYIGFRLNQTNLGLEHNLIEACQPCRGRYVLIMGNDDKLYPGALDEVLSDIQSDTHDLIVYGKVRIDPNGDIMTNPAKGSTPADAEVGERREYDGALGFARSTGILSGYGFISVVLMRRTSFLDVEAEKYLGLTMYPQVGRLLEAFSDAPTMFHNIPVVFHRTTARSEKLAEAAGRPEESFMVGGADRDMRWFGPTFAALLMRVCDASSINPVDFADLPEHLFGHERLIDWIRQNTELARERDLEIAADVRDDAERFLASFTSAEAARLPTADSESTNQSAEVTEAATAAEMVNAATEVGTEPVTKMVAAPVSTTRTTELVTVTRVELETLVGRVEALEEALDSLVSGD